LSAASGCGCVSAALVASELAPQEVTTVACTIDLVKSPGSKNTTVIIGGRTASNKVAFPLTLFIHEDESGVQRTIVDSDDGQIYVERPWARDLAIELSRSIVYGSDLRLDDLSISASSSCLSGKLVDTDPVGHVATLRVTVAAPPAGRLGASVYVNCPAANGDVLRSCVTIDGWIEPRYSAVPGFVNCGTIDVGAKTEARILVRPRDEEATEPLLKIDGPWRIIGSTRRGAHAIEVRVTPETRDRGADLDGTLLVGGDQGETPLRIPLRVSLAPSS